MAATAYKGPTFGAPVKPVDNQKASAPAYSGPSFGTAKIEKKEESKIEVDFERQKTVAAKIEVIIEEPKAKATLEIRSWWEARKRESGRA